MGQLPHGEKTEEEECEEWEREEEVLGVEGGSLSRADKPTRLLISSRKAGNVTAKFSTSINKSASPGLALEGILCASGLSLPL
ncbi:unnamed protein product [Merluccius merluccius]